MRYPLIITVFLSFASLSAGSQTFEWWKNLVQWNGVTPWQNYIIYSPRYLGPNALPVPKMGTGSIDSVNSFSVRGNFYFSKGDETINPAIYANYCLVKDVISLDAYWVPVERFSMSHTLKEERRVYYLYYDDKTAHGDVHFNLNVQVLNKIRKNIHLAVRFGYRYASSGKVGAARFTDAPGYFFDLSAGRLFNETSAWKWIAMAGFLVWQTNSTNFGQDDAFLFGAGLEYNKNGLQMQTSISGYRGYLSNGDAPILYRLHLKKTKKRWGWILQLQHGIHDFIYTGIEAGVNYRFKEFR